MHYCRECLLLDPPVRNKKISNKKRRLCTTHYRKFCAENHCHEHGCKRLAKSADGRCAVHAPKESKQCIHPGCTNELKARATYCDRCYMRQWRLAKKHEEGDTDERKKEAFQSSFSTENGEGQIVSPALFTETVELHNGIVDILEEHQRNQGVWITMFCDGNAPFFLSGAELGLHGSQTLSAQILCRIYTEKKNDKPTNKRQRIWTDSSLKKKEKEESKRDGDTRQGMYSIGVKAKRSKRSGAFVRENLLRQTARHFSV